MCDAIAQVERRSLAFFEYGEWRRKTLGGAGLPEHVSKADEAAARRARERQDAAELVSWF